jgi:hypothetical protein
MNFSFLRKNNLSFIGTASNMDDYRKWASQQICEFCGAKASDRPRDKNEKLLDLWVTETRCNRKECWNIYKTKHS